jgi:hypothetical protein
MAVAKFKSGSVDGRRRAIGAAAASVVLGASLIAAPQASAASSPTTADLLSACAWASYCAFNADNYWTYIGPAHQVGSTIYNCASSTNYESVSWSDTTGSANSVGVAISATAIFEEVFEVEIQTSYQHTWTVSHTDSQTDTEYVRPKYTGWMMRGTSKQEATGWYEIHFNKPYYGHYVWYVENYTESGFNADNPYAGYVTFHDRPMTSAERAAQHC